MNPIVNGMVKDILKSGEGVGIRVAAEVADNEVEKDAR